jgi:hypothetical protein
MPKKIKPPKHFKDAFYNKKVKLGTDSVTEEVTFIRTPSGQLWNSWSPTRQEEWRQLVISMGENPEDYLTHMRSMLPKNPKGA